MTTPTFNKDDSATRAGLMALETHVTAMMQAGQTAYSIRGNISSGYVAGSSDIFTRNVDAWISNYNAVMKKFQELGYKVGAVSNLIDSAEEDAGLAGASWGSDSQIYDALVPTK